jgi:hypothetical protein
VKEESQKNEQEAKSTAMQLNMFKQMAEAVK